MLNVCIMCLHDTEGPVCYNRIVPLNLLIFIHIFDTIEFFYVSQILGFVAILTVSFRVNSLLESSLSR